MTQENKFTYEMAQPRPARSFVQRLVMLSLWLLLSSGPVYAQGVPRIGHQLEFAGVMIHLTDATQHLVQQEAELLYVNRALVTSRLERMTLYFPIIRPFLAQQGLPDDFLFLALHDPAPVSGKPTLAFWGLGKSTPAELRMDAFVDERLHPVRSTLAAVNRLNRLYQRKPNWVAVIHHYERSLRADTTQLADKKPVDGALYALNDTSDEFLIRLLAAKVVLERALSVYKPQPQQVLFPYEETRGMSLSQIAGNCRVDESSVSPHNTWLKSPRVPETEDYTVYIPTTLDRYIELKRKTGSSVESQLAMQDAGFPVLQKSAAPSDVRGGQFYRINGKKGIQAQLFDNRITLAYRGRLKVKKFETYNDLRSDQPIVAGEIYYLEKKSKRARVPFHIVRRGQSLWAIAQQYGIKLQKLIAYNAVNPEQQPAVARILWLQKERPASLPVEYYRSPRQPDQPPGTTQAKPVLAVNKPDSEAKNPPVSLTDSIRNPKERLATAEKISSAVPNGRTLATLDSLIAALNKSEMPAFRSGAAKMIVPSVPVEKTAGTKMDDEPEEVSGPLIMHIAEKTDTYATVARKYNVTVQQLYLWNNVSALKPLRPGQPLLIDQSVSPTRKGLVPLAAKPALSKPPVIKPAPRPPAVKPAATPSAGGPVVKPAAAPVDSGEELIHIVQAGENMYRIGLRYKVKPEQVKQWNNLPDLTAVVGARLIIRKK
ncbi:LysM peptidoglycan-binding domain-containing protein [Larkinella bovis]|uniref:LysM peptidoglycan-binding domain-containing protein n=1 Tax=Larkinella bovis TaxID=683041 RepID=A0ABW0IDL2_9BACT